MQADKNQITNLLKTARGQIDGLLKMVEENRYCIEISTQLSATQSILKKINLEILESHLNCCVKKTLETGSEEEKQNIIKEITSLINKITK